MISSDSIELLKECDAGTKMAVSSIDEVLDQVKSSELKNVLQQSKNQHSQIGNQIHKLLIQNEENDKEPNPVAKGLAWVKTNMKMMMDDSDKTVADLITDGCNMGVKSLNKYLNQYENADDKSKSICKELIHIESELTSNLCAFL